MHISRTELDLYIAATEADAALDEDTADTLYGLADEEASAATFDR